MCASLGCFLGQGWHYAKALPADDATRVAASRRYRPLRERVTAG